MRGLDELLSFGQRRIWFLEQAAPGNTAYVNQDARMLHGELDVDALDKALNIVVARHDSLRTRFVVNKNDGSPRQRVEPIVDHRLELLDAPAIPARQRDPFIQEFARSEAARPFDLAGEPLMRTYLLRWAEHEHTLLTIVHHITIDGWSLTNLYRELSIAYNAMVSGADPHLPELSIQYPEFARQQRERLTPERLAGELDFWRDYLAGAPVGLDLPTDRPRPATQTMRGDIINVMLPDGTAEQVRRLAVAARATTYMVLAACVAIVLRRHSGQSEIVFGTPVAGRTRTELEPLIGLFLNMIAVRVPVDPNGTVADLVRRTRSATITALSHQEIPFERVVQGVVTERRPNVSPVFQVSLSVNNLPDDPLTLAGIRTEQVHIELGGSRYDLTATFVPEPLGLRLRLQYNSDLFDAATMHGLIDDIVAVVGAAAADPKTVVRELPVRGPRERPTPSSTVDCRSRQADRQATAESAAAAAAVRDIFADVLDRPDLGTDDSFFTSGGHSLLSVALILRLQDIFPTIVLTPADIVASPTPAALAKTIAVSESTLDDADPVRPLRATGSLAPVFCLPPTDRDVLTCTELLRHIPVDFPVYSIRPRAASTAREHMALIRELHPHDSYVLAGWSSAPRSTEVAELLTGAGYETLLLTEETLAQLGSRLGPALRARFGTG